NRFDPLKEKSDVLQYSLNFSKDVDESGHKLTMDFQYEDTSEDEFSNVLVEGVNSERVNTLRDQSRILLQADYVLPLGEKSQFELGYRGNFKDQDTDYLVEIFDATSNDFINNTDRKSVV